MLKRARYALVLALTLAALSASGCPARATRTGTPPGRPPQPRSKKRIRLTLLSINDFHGQLAPRQLETLETPPRMFRVGGAEALAATVAALRAEDPEHTLLLDAGDFMQGSLLSNHFEGAPVREMHRLLGVAAAAVGNHEFDFGPRGPRVLARSGEDKRGALKAWASRAAFPLLSANIARSDGELVSWPNVQPTALLQRGGVRIGLIGLTTPTTPETTMPQNVSDLRFLPMLPVVRRRAAELRRRGAQIVVLVAHVGGTCKSREPRSCHGELFDLLRALPRGTVDAVMAGHSHRCIWHEINGVLVTEACSRGVAIGRIELVLTGGRVDRAASRALAPRPVCHQVFDDTGGCQGLRRRGPRHGRLLDNPLLSRHRALVKRVRRALSGYRDRIRQMAQRPVASTLRVIRHRRHGHSPLGALLAKLMLEAVDSADVALMNAGGVRADLGPGTVTYADVFRVFPFDNQLATVELTGAQLHQLIAAYLRRPHSGVMQVAGVKLKIRCGDSKQLAGLTDLAGKPLPDDRRYTVAMSDFMASGGDGLGEVLDSVEASRKRVLAGRFIREEMVKLLEKHDSPLDGPNGPLPRGDQVTVELVGQPCGRPARRARPICR